MCRKLLCVRLPALAALFFVAVLSCASLCFSENASGGLGEEEYARLKLVKEAYLKMDKFYYTDIKKENVGNLFYRCQFIMLSILKNPVQDYMEELDRLTYSTLNMIVTALKDKTDAYSKFIHKDLLTRVVRENLTSRFAGIGIEVEKKDARFFIAKVYADSSAEEENVLVGDELIAINATPVAGLDLKEIEGFLKIPNGEFVELELVRPGAPETFTVTLQCRIIRVPSVLSKYYEDTSSGLIHIKGFRNETAAEFSAHLAELERNQMRGLVIDLRGNTGGDETQVVELAGLFLPHDTLVVYFMKKDVGRREERTKRSPQKIDYPVVVLTDEKTASSAEIFAGVLKYYEKAFVVGTVTNGQGSLKNTIGLSDGSALLLVTSRTFLPDDKTFDQIGIVPHIEVRGENAQLQKAFDIIQGREAVIIK
jgi:carboxyl-terminal processing protease